MLVKPYLIKTSDHSLKQPPRKKKNQTKKNPITNNCKWKPRHLLGQSKKCNIYSSLLTTVLNSNLPKLSFLSNCYFLLRFSFHLQAS